MWQTSGGDSAIFQSLYFNILKWSDIRGNRMLDYWCCNCKHSQLSLHCTGVDKCNIVTRTSFVRSSLASFWFLLLWQVYGVCSAQMFNKIIYLGKGKNQNDAHESLRYGFNILIPWSQSCPYTHPLWNHSMIKRVALSQEKKRSIPSGTMKIFLALDLFNLCLPFMSNWEGLFIFQIPQTAKE